MKQITLGRGQAKMEAFIVPVNAASVGLTVWVAMEDRF